MLHYKFVSAFDRDELKIMTVFPATDHILSCPHPDFVYVGRTLSLAPWMYQGELEGAGLPLFPMKVAQWRMKQKTLDIWV